MEKGAKRLFKSITEENRLPKLDRHRPRVAPSNAIAALEIRRGISRHNGSSVTHFFYFTLLVRR